MRNGPSDESPSHGWLPNLLSPNLSSSKILQTIKLENFPQKPSVEINNRKSREPILASKCKWKNSLIPRRGREVSTITAADPFPFINTRSDDHSDLFRAVQHLPNIRSKWRRKWKWFHLILTKAIHMGIQDFAVYQFLRHELLCVKWMCTDEQIKFTSLQSLCL